MLPASLRVHTEPATEPITAAEAKLHARIETDADDALVSMWIKAARMTAETMTQRRLISQTIEAQYDDWPRTSNSYEIWLPGPPLVSVTTVKYYDTDGTEQTLSTDVYEVNTAKEPGVVTLKPNQVWPTLQSGKATPITIRYVAGYTNAAAVPDLIKAGMYLLIAHMNKYREEVAAGTLTKIPFGAQQCFGLCAVPWGH